MPKGGAVAEVSDVSGLHVLVPLDRADAKAGAEVALRVEGRPASGKIRAILPLPESFAPLRELANPLVGAWVTIDNAGGTLEPGQRVATESVPEAPLANVPAQAIRDGAEGPEIQVLRNELVADLPVRVLGEAGVERLQVSGAFRPGDILIVSSTIPLLAGTLVRFGGDSAPGPVEPLGPRPDEVGQVAGITPPSRPGAPPTRTSARPGVAPIGPPGSALPRGAAPPATAPAAPPRPATPSNTIPF